MGGRVVLTDFFATQGHREPVFQTSEFHPQGLQVPQAAEKGQSIQMQQTNQAAAQSTLEVVTCILDKSVLGKSITFLHTPTRRLCIHKQDEKLRSINHLSQMCFNWRQKWSEAGRQCFLCNTGLKYLSSPSENDHVVQIRLEVQLRH